MTTPNNSQPAAASSIYGSASYPYTDTGDYFSPNWVDFRVNIYGPSGDSGTIVWFYIIHTCTTPLFIMLGLFLIYKKVIVPRTFPFRWYQGAVVPRATEGWLLCSTMFLFLRWIYGTLILTNRIPSFAVREFLHESAWFTLYNGGVLYTFALVHGTAKKETRRNNRLSTKDLAGIVFVPNAIILNALYFAYCVSPAIPLTLGSIAGSYADHGDYARARDVTIWHYVSWSALCIVFCTLLMFFGITLMRMLRYNMEISKADRHDASIQNTLKNSMFTVKLFMIGLFGMGFIFAVMLGGYAAWRNSIHSIYGVQYTLAATWIFNAPFLIFLTHFAIALNIWRAANKKPFDTAQRGTRTSSTISSTALNEATYHPMKTLSQDNTPIIHQTPHAFSTKYDRHVVPYPLEPSAVALKAATPTSPRVAQQPNHIASPQLLDAAAAAGAAGATGGHWHSDADAVTLGSSATLTTAGYLGETTTSPSSNTFITTSTDAASPLTRRVTTPGAGGYPPNPSLPQPALTSSLSRSNTLDNYNSTGSHTSSSNGGGGNTTISHRNSQSLMSPTSGVGMISSPLPPSSPFIGSGSGVPRTSVEAINGWDTSNSAPSGMTQYNQNQNLSGSFDDVPSFDAFMADGFGSPTPVRREKRPSGSNGNTGAQFEPAVPFSRATLNLLRASTTKK